MRNAVRRGEEGRTPAVVANVDAARQAYEDARARANALTADASAAAEEAVAWEEAQAGVAKIVSSNAEGRMGKGAAERDGSTAASPPSPESVLAAYLY